MAFRIGQQVVCVKVYPKRETALLQSALWPRSPVKGEILTIREIYNGFSDHGPEIGLRFEEIICKIHPYFENECGFTAERFRPVVKTDISIFQAMLAPTMENSASFEGVPFS